MNQSNLSKAKKTIQILSNKKCQEVVEMLTKYPNSCVGKIEYVLDLTQSETSQRLARLRSVGLVNTNRVGKNIYYSLNEEKVTYFENLLKQF